MDSGWRDGQALSGRRVLSAGKPANRRAGAEEISASKTNGRRCGSEISGRQENNVAAMAKIKLAVTCMA